MSESTNSVGPCQSNDQTQDTVPTAAELAVHLRELAEKTNGHPMRAVMLPARLVHIVADKLEAQREFSQEFIAKAMAYNGCGDPHAIDRNGQQRWTWYANKAADFLTLFAYLRREGR